MTIHIKILPGKSFAKWQEPTGENTYKPVQRYFHNSELPQLLQLCKEQGISVTFPLLS